MEGMRTGAAVPPPLPKNLRKGPMTADTAESLAAITNAEADRIREEEAAAKAAATAEDAGHDDVAREMRALQRIQDAREEAKFKKTGFSDVAPEEGSEAEADRIAAEAVQEADAKAELEENLRGTDALFHAVKELGQTAFDAQARKELEKGREAYEKRVQEILKEAKRREAAREEAHEEQVNEALMKRVKANIAKLAPDANAFVPKKGGPKVMKPGVDLFAKGQGE